MDRQHQPVVRKIAMLLLLTIPEDKRTNDVINQQFAVARNAVELSTNSKISDEDFYGMIQGFKKVFHPEYQDENHKNENS